MRRNLLLIDGKKCSIVKRDVLYTQVGIYSIGFPFLEHNCIIASMSELVATVMTLQGAFAIKQR